VTIDFQGHFFTAAGVAINGATVDIFTVATAANPCTASSSATASTTTDCTGLWTSANVADGVYDVRLVTGSSVRWLRQEDKVQVCKITANEMQLRDGGDLFFGAGEDAAIRWSKCQTSSNDSLTLGLGNSNQGLHITDLGAITTDWGGISATTHPNVYIHSNTTPVNDYLRLGGHDGTTAYVDVVGGTTLALAIGGTSQVKLIDGALAPVCDNDVDLGTSSLEFKDAFFDGTITTDAICGGAITGTTIDATTDFTIGDTVITNGVITDSSGLQLAANLDINGTADISGDLTLSAGGDGALRFSAASSIKMLDNSATALVIEEADNAYITFDTRNCAEVITIAKATTFSSTIAAATGSTIGNLTLANGSITDSGGALDFGNETLTTTGVITGGGFTIGSAVIVEAELEMIDGITAGTAAASKAVVLDGSKNIATIGTIGSAAITSTGVVTATGFTIGSAAITETELEILDGASVTTTELNLIDGGTSRDTNAVASGDGILINDNGTMHMTNVDTVSTYFASHSVGGAAMVTVGTLGAGAISSGFGNIDIGTSTFGATGTHTGPSGTWDSGGMDIASGDSYAINGTDVLTATALGTGMQASRAAIEAETDENTYVPPDLIKNSPGVLKAWVRFVGSGCVSVVASYNLEACTPITDNGTGDYSINVGTNFSSVNYAVSLTVADCGHASQDGAVPAVCSLRFFTFNNACPAVKADNSRIFSMMAGDQ
jgi:hypothetical protein